MQVFLSREGPAQSASPAGLDHGCGAERAAGSRAAQWLPVVQSLVDRAGRQQLIGFFIGQAMKDTGGRADPQVVQKLVREALA